MNRKMTIALASVYHAGFIALFTKVVAEIYGEKQYKKGYDLGCTCGKLFGKTELLNELFKQQNSNETDKKEENDN